MELIRVGARGAGTPPAVKTASEWKRNDGSNCAAMGTALGHYHFVQSIIVKPHVIRDPLRTFSQCAGMLCGAKFRDHREDYYILAAHEREDRCWA